MSFTTLPPSEIVPDVGRSNPAIRRNAVVLPEPDGPTIAKHSRSSAVRLNSDKARIDPAPELSNTFVTASSTTRGTGRLFQRPAHNVEIAEMTCRAAFPGCGLRALSSAPQ